jgi:DegV family protein with EDD domain
MTYSIGPEEYPALLDWSIHSPKEFYDFMRCGTVIKTSQVSIPCYEEHFTKSLAEGKDILYISCSSALSGSINVARLVAKNLATEYPERTICCVDSLISSLGQGYLVIRAAELREQGYSMAETASQIEAMKLHVNQYATVGSLEYLRRAGRVTAASSFFGNFFGIKPILISDKIGQNYAIRKVKGSANTRLEMAKEIAAVVEEPEKQCLYISHADALEDAQALRDAIMNLSAFRDCHIGVIAPIVGASVGPGTVAAYCFGKEVTIEGEN